jgi:predicted GNAT superfamily acetyltransferase
LISQIQQVEELQKEVWGFSDRDVVPSDQLMIAKEVGGLLIGAFVEETLVGFAYALLSIERDRLQFHSHMLAVKPGYRNLGLGYQLKLAQRERALARGIARMTWTFDPLQCMNAHFNLAKLGVVSDRYRINFYGESTSSFLHRHGTDRLWVTWHLDSERVCRRLQAGTLAGSVLAGLDECTRLVELGTDDAPHSPELAQWIGQRQVLIEIPEDIGTLEIRDSNLAMAWRDATRRAFSAAIAAGYVVEEFRIATHGPKRIGIYLLIRKQESGDLTMYSVS